MVSIVLMALMALMTLMPQFAWSRPLLPEPPMGTGASSFSGGGVAFMGGPNAIFTNPAALAIPDGVQTEAGMMGLSEGLFPYFLFGSSGSAHTHYALGYFFDGRVDPLKGGPSRQGMVAGGSWEVDSKASLGVSVHSQGTGSGLGQTGLGVDVDAGALFRPIKVLWLGLALRNLEESGVGPSPSGYRTRRSYLGAVGLRTTRYDFLGIRFQDPHTFYDFRMAGFPPTGMTHSVTAGSSFMPGGRLGFRISALFPQGGQAGFAIGTFTNFPAGRTSTMVGYTFDSGAGDGVIGEHTATHSLSVNFRMGGNRDHFPPLVEVKADKLVLNSNEAGDVSVNFRLMVRDKTLVSRKIANENREEQGGEKHPVELGLLGYGRQLEEGRIRNWKLLISTVDTQGKIGKQAKVFVGKDLPPRLIHWDGRDDFGQTMTPGIYAFQLSAEDLASNRSVTVWQLLDLTGSKEPGSEVEDQDQDQDLEPMPESSEN
jgi:hypothetical protein